LAADLFGRLRPLLFGLEPERAHALTLAALRWLPLPALAAPAGAPVQTLGLRFPNPIGLAAGFDKNAEAPEALLRLGFGFVEVGTLTPRPQAGNPRPRLFRLVEDDAIINRLGFNNAGLEAGVRRLEAVRARGCTGIIGVNVGANKDSDDRIADYAAGIARVRQIASYITVNISSPNTPGLRALQSRASLAELIDRCQTARGPSSVPLLVKIAPDLTETDLDDIAALALQSRLDGLIVSNTTISRPASLRARHAGETGGLSGRPLMAPSTAVLAQIRERVGPDLPLIGVGGITSPADVAAKQAAGATLVQLYSALVYQGPGLVRLLVRASGRA
jgi:dihydroorotate dehydrogenase